MPSQAELQQPSRAPPPECCPRDAQRELTLRDRLIVPADISNATLRSIILSATKGTTVWDEGRHTDYPDDHSKYSDWSEYNKAPHTDHSEYDKYSDHDDYSDSHSDNW